MIGSDFQPMILKYARRCDCKREMVPGKTYLASVKDGKVRKWVCSEDCRLEFDARVWEQFAKRNENRRRTAAELRADENRTVAKQIIVEAESVLARIRAAKEKP